MAKKAIAKTRSKDTKSLVKLILCARSSKTGAYTFKTDIVTPEEAQQLLKKTQHPSKTPTS